MRMGINPVLEKDLKTKLRGWRSTILICCYVLLLGGILVIYFAGNNMLSVYGVRTFNPRMAVEAYNILITFQFALLFLAVPAITATSISSERERQTLDLMLVTKTPAVKVILGKIMVSLAHTMLLLVASLPVVGVVFFFGGIGFWDIGRILLFYVFTAFFVASAGVFFSTVFKRNIVSIIMTYLFLGFVTFGPLFFFGVYALMQQRLPGSFNPSYGQLVSFMFPSPVFGFTSLYIGGTSLYSSGYYGGSLFSEAAQLIEMMMAQTPGLGKFMKPWIINSLFSILSSALLIFFGSKALNPIHRKK